ncbi:MAG: hypothetical protein EHM23_09360 [Acidobacteria bacterium]|nr:MAG: hypothetical protein EHM23_09360 [Acidobacteriota bacterium]
MTGRNVGERGRIDGHSDPVGVTTSVSVIDSEVEFQRRRANGDRGRSEGRLRCIGTCKVYQGSADLCPRKAQRVAIGVGAGVVFYWPTATVLVRNTAI